MTASEARKAIVWRMTIGCCEELYRYFNSIRVRSFILNGAPSSVKVGHHGTHLLVTLDEIANRVVRPNDADLLGSDANLCNEQAKPLAAEGWI